MTEHFPYSRGEMSLERYLHFLLPAILSKSPNHEIRIKAADILKITPESAIERSFDLHKGEIILRLGHYESEIYFIAPTQKERNEWPTGTPRTTYSATSRPSQTRPLTPPPPNPYQESEVEPEPPPPPLRHTVLDDVALFLRDQQSQSARKEAESARERSRRSQDGRLYTVPPGQRPM